MLSLGQTIHLLSILTVSISDKFLVLKSPSVSLISHTPCLWCYEKKQKAKKKKYYFIQIDLTSRDFYSLIFYSEDYGLL